MIRTAAILTVCAVLALALAASASAADNGGLVLGVKPGALLQSAHFGFSTGFIMPYAGFDHLGISVDAGELSASAALYIPHFGAKLFFNQGAGKGDVTPSIAADFFTSMASVDLDVEGLTDEELDMDEILDTAEELLEFWGFNLAFGAEYFLSDNFSVGGEYGLRYLKDSVEIGEEGEELLEDLVDEISASFRMTYAGVCLSYYF